MSVQCEFFLEISEIFLEIREIAGIMLELVKNIDGQPFEHTLSAWELMNE